jgi:AbrB family looped-hinge helix DNA binding protein
MDSSELEIGEQGEIIIPEEIRRLLNLSTGKKVLLTQADNIINITPIHLKTSEVFTQFALEHKRNLKIDSDADYVEMVHDRVG